MVALGKLKGVDLYFYKVKQVKIKEHGKKLRTVLKYTEVPVAEATMYNLRTTQKLTKDYYELGDTPEFWYKYLDRLYNRCDPDLVKVVEQLKDKADGLNAELFVVELGDHDVYRVTNDDGMESLEVLLTIGEDGVLY